MSNTYLAQIIIIGRNLLGSKNALFLKTVAITNMAYKLQPNETLR